MSAPPPSPPPEWLEPDPDHPGVLRPAGSAAHAPASAPSSAPDAPTGAAYPRGGASQAATGAGHPPIAHPDVRFMASHLAHPIALGFGSGLPRRAPGTVGTLWAWAAFAILQPWFNDVQWASFIGVNLLLGWWACTVTARHMGLPDSSHMVWDEVVAFWLVLWMLKPAGFWTECMAFGLFRLFDAVKFGPMAWADRHFKGFGPRGGFGVMLDDLMAAFCTLLIMALWKSWS